MAKFEFGFKEAWFRLIIKKLPEHPDLFLPREVEKAQAILRVGKLKVGAARVWAETAGIIIKKKNQFFLSPLGQLIARHDPDFDEDGIWWLIHYHLARRGSPAWFYSYYFNRFDLDEFSRGQLETQVRAHWDNSHDKKMKDSVFDKLIFSPLKQVFEGTRMGDGFGFWQTNEKGNYYRTAFCATPVPMAILAYALVGWGRQNNRKSVHLEKLMDDGGIGKIFRLERDTLDMLLVDIGEYYQKQAGWISHTAGLNSVSITDIPPLALVSAYYHELDGDESAEALAKGLEEAKRLMKK